MFEYRLHWKHGCRVEPRGNSDLIQCMHLYIRCADVLEISLCVIFQVIGDAEPDGEMRRMRQLISSQCSMWMSEWRGFNEITYHSAFFLPFKKFSRIMPATVRPFPTPAPSPMRKPARWLFCKITSCCCVIKTATLMACNCHDFGQQ